MFDGLVVHERTQASLTRFTGHPSHAILLAGPHGIGKTALASTLIAEVLKIQPEQLADQPYFLRVSPDERGSISIEQARTIQTFLQLKTVGKQSFRRAVLVEHADGFTTEAQNAFLKILEEPPADTIIVLTAASARQLLPTIVSRVQAININIPESRQLNTFFSANGFDRQAITQSYFMSGGLPGLMSALLDHAKGHPLLASVQSAKELLQKEPFERLASVDTLSKQRGETANVLAALERISSSALQQATQKQNARAVAQWHRIRREALAAQAALGQNANPKLVLTKMLLHLP